jgi:uncharacterized protein YndB with AHSA1/START domain
VAECRRRKSSFVVRRQGQDLDHNGEYLEIDRPRRLAFTWTVGPDATSATRVTIDLAPSGSGTDLTLTHERIVREYAERTEEGWRAIVDAVDGSMPRA